MKNYIINKVQKEPQLNADWCSEDWKDANVAEISIFRTESSDHRPKTELKLLYNSEGIFGHFNVKDQYIRSIESGYQTPVCQDSCVEFFVQPKPEKGYLNFEFNCGGALLSYYITDSTRTENGFKEMVQLTDEELDQIKIHHSMPGITEPEIKEPKEWNLSFFVPFSILQNYVGSLNPVDNSEWCANFYKCGDNTSHPHWASWSPLSATNFHLPECFGTLKFQ